MASVLLDLGLYGHDSLLASLGCPQPGPDLLSSGFLGSLRPVTSKKCPFHLAFLCQLRKPITHFPSSGEAWTCRSEPRRWGLEHLTWEKRLRKLGLPVWKRESSGGSYSHVCINIWWDGMKKSKPIFPVLYGDNLRGSGHKAKKLNSFWTHSSPTFFYSEYDQTLAQIKRFSLRMMKHRLPKVFLGHVPWTYLGNKLLLHQQEAGAGDFQWSVPISAILPLGENFLVHVPWMEMCQYQTLQLTQI